MEFGPKSIKAIFFLAWLDFFISGMFFFMMAVDTFLISGKLSGLEVSDISSGTLNGSTTPSPIIPRSIYTNAAALVIKIFYFVSLFLLAETCLAAYLIRALQRKNERAMRIWLILMSVITIFYLTDLLSTLHAMTLFEDIPLSFSIFVKAPLLFLVYKYHGHLVSQHGHHLENVNASF